MINIQQLPAAAIMMVISGAVAAIDSLHRLPQLLYIFCLASTQGGTDNRFGRHSGRAQRQPTKRHLALPVG